jgi:hypothetical protein
MSAVPELLVKRRKRDEAWAAQKAAAALEARKKARAGRTEIFKRAELYVKEYREQVRSTSSHGAHGHSAAGWRLAGCAAVACDGLASAASAIS